MTPFYTDDIASFTGKITSGLGKASKRGISFTKGTGRSAVENIGRVDHGSRHLFKAGILEGSPGSKVAREVFRDYAANLLENPIKTFDHVMKQGGQRVKGFHGQINGRNVIMFVAKKPSGKIRAGDLVTTIVLSPQQVANWGL